MHHNMRRAVAGVSPGGGGGYDTLNPLDKAVFVTLSESNLRLTTTDTTANQFNGSRGVNAITKDLYIEFEVMVIHVIFGIGSLNDDLIEGGSGMMWEPGGDGAAVYSSTGTIIANGLQPAILPGGSFGVGEIIGIAYDFTNGEIYARDATGYAQVGGTPQDPVAKTDGIPLNNITGLDPYIIAHGQSTLDSVRYNSGEAGFTYPVPTGYQAGHFV